MNFDIIKCHGACNDFALIDEINNNYNFTEDDRRKLAILLCDREGPVGGDGVVFMSKSNSCDGKMRIFNADGTEPEMCGNVLRNVGRFVMENFKKDEVTIETMKADYKVRKVKDIFDGVYTDEIELKAISFNPEDLPLISEKDKVIFQPIPELSAKEKFTAIACPNPHLVVLTDEIKADEIEEVGIKANSTKSVLPQGSNVNYLKVLDGDTVYVKTYERGVGFTKACGTGMTASIVACTIAHPEMKNKPIKIYNDGGMIINTVVENEEGLKVIMVGNATFVYTATVKYEDNTISVSNKKEFVEENESYDKFLEFTNAVEK